MANIDTLGGIKNVNKKHKEMKWFINCTQGTATGGERAGERKKVY